MAIHRDGGASNSEIESWCPANHGMPNRLSLDDVENCAYYCSEVLVMTALNSACEGDWSVSAETNQTDAGFDCCIHMRHTTPGGAFEHEFKHSSIFPTEREAVLAGLREGMVWIELKVSNALNLQESSA